MANLLLSILVVGLLLGGPLTLFVIIKVLSNVWGGLTAKFIRTAADGPLALQLAWDDESFDIKIARIRIEFIELVKGGRSFAHSFTFDDSSVKKRSFALPLTLLPEDVAMLTDGGIASAPRAVKFSTANIEVETLTGEVRRFKINKTKILKSVQTVTTLPKEIELLDPVGPDSWSVQTRVFPWKKKEEEEISEDKAHKKAVGGPAAPRAVVDFAVSKVWIEPGCIVCDACEAEAPEVFWVLADTCIVRENAPLGDAAAIKAAAEGCPVDVIKYTKVPKAAAGA